MYEIITMGLSQYGYFGAISYDRSWNVVGCIADVPAEPYEYFYKRIQGADRMPGISHEKTFERLLSEAFKACGQPLVHPRQFIQMESGFE